MNLSPADQAEYDALLAPLETNKQAAVAAGNAANAKFWRRSISRLHDQFAARQPPPPPPTEYERELSLTLEERVDRIERVLLLGRYDPNIKFDI